MTTDALFPVLLAASALFGILAVVHLVAEPPAQGRPLAAVAGALAVVFGLARWACSAPRPGRWVRAHPDGVSLAAGLTASLHGYATLLVTDQPAAAGPIILFVVVAGSLGTVRRYALVVVCAALAQWFSVAAAHHFEGEWGLTSVMVLCAPVLAQVLWHARRRNADSLAAAEAALLEAAMTDEMTGLTNRRGLMAVARAALLRPGPHPVSVLYLDIDGLKATNDRYGHATGDALVRAAAQTLLAGARKSDTVARLGGDEFAVLLDSTDANDAAALRDRLHHSLAAAGVSASMGWAQARPGGDVERLLRDADQAMYAAKPSRRGPGGGLATPPAELTAPPPPGASGGAPRSTADVAPRAAESADLTALSLSGALMFAALAPAHLILQPAGQGGLLAALVLAAAAAFAILHRLRDRPTVGRRPDLALAACLLLVSAECVALVAVVGQPWATTAVLMSVLATGALVRSRVLAAAVVLSTVVTWTVVAAAHGGGATWRDHAVHLGSAVVTAGLLHVTASRTIDRLTLAQQRVRAIALTDELTGLANRRGFLVHGRPLLELSRRHGHSASVLLLDLDGLKHVNDTQGHAAGDQLIAAAADALRRVSGDDDLCARLGGDEFSVLVHGYPARQVPARVGWLQHALAEAGVHASIGVAHVGGGDTSLEGLIGEADAAMYLDKQQRRTVGADHTQPRRAVPADRRTRCAPG
jgi:diguanylate cyclase (GGDEF)-like protein